MKVVRFPDRHATRGDAGDAIDAALDGETAGAEAAALRMLREDVRSLAAPLDTEFERELQARVAEWGAQRSTGSGVLRRRRLGRWRDGMSGATGRWLALGGVAATAAAIVLAIALNAGHPGVHATAKSGRAGTPSAAELSSRHKAARSAFGPVQSSPAQTAHQTAPTIAAGSEATAATPSAPGRLQQLGASVSLATDASQVQAVADGVTRLAVSDGGYVQSSHMQVRQGGPSEATLTLSVPSAKLASTVAALGRIASLRAVNQESQDITDSFDADKRRLGDDEAVRRALLRALAAATAQGSIDTLREQLAGNRGALARDRSTLQSISRQAATSQLEVTIVGGAGAKSRTGEAPHEGLTLRRGVHDAGHVLAGVGAVLLIALAVLVPLALIAIVLDAVRRAWLRRRREAALGQ
jgi:hypothetical protein